MLLLIADEMAEIAQKVAQAGQNGQFDMTSLSPLVSSVMSLGFSVWFAVHVIKVYLPRREREHREERAAMQLAFNATLDKFDATVGKLVTELTATRENYWRDKRRNDS